MMKTRQVRQLSPKNTIFFLKNSFKNTSTSRLRNHATTSTTISCATTIDSAKCTTRFTSLSDVLTARWFQRSKRQPPVQVSMSEITHHHRRYNCWHHWAGDCCHKFPTGFSLSKYKLFLVIFHIFNFNIEN